MVAGAMTAFGWVTSPDPRQYIGDMLNAVPVYGRQILAEYPQEAHQSLVQVENNPFHAGPRVLDTHLVCPGHTTSLSWTHTQSVLDTPAPSSTQPGVPQALKFLLRGLQDYVTTLHPHGLVWNTKNTGAAAPRRRSPHKQQVLAPSHRARFCTQLHHLVFLRPRSVNAHSRPRSLSRFTLPLAGARHGGGPPPPPSRTDWTRLVPPAVLTGHVSPVGTGAAGAGPASPHARAAPGDGQAAHTHVRRHHRLRAVRARCPRLLTPRSPCLEFDAWVCGRCRQRKQHRSPSPQRFPCGDPFDATNASLSRLRETAAAGSE